MDLRDARGETSVTSFTLWAMNVSFKIRCSTVSIEREIPRDVFIKYRNENMKKNYIDEIALVDSNAAQALS
jgi:hypothetical protein